MTVLLSVQIMERSVGAWGGDGEGRGQGRKAVQSLRPCDLLTDGQTDTEDLGPLGESGKRSSVGRKEPSWCSEILGLARP